MARIHYLQQRKADLLKQMQAQRDTVAAANRPMTDEERTAFAGLEAQYDANQDELAAEERLQERERTMAAVPDPNEVVQRANEARAQISVKDRAEDDPAKGFTSHREFLSAVMEVGSGRRMDGRLAPLKQQAAAGSDEHGVYSDPHGGFLVPEAFSPTLLQLQPEDDPMASRVQRMPMTNPTVTLPARVDKNHTSSVSGGLTVTRRPETVAAADSRMTLERITWRAHSLFGLSFATEEILTDSPISFVALIANSFRQEFGSKLIEERLTGTGVGEFEGVLNSPAKVVVAKETGQAAATIVYENLKKMRSRVWGYSRPSTIWLANHDTMPDLMSLVQVVGTGGAPIYQPSAREDRPDVLLGRPIIYTEYTKTIGTEGDVVAVNWGEYVEGTYQPLQSAESMHVRFINHERTFKFWLRNDAKCWWRAALTPKHSAKTLSPIVVLAARA